MSDQCIFSRSVDTRDNLARACGKETGDSKPEPKVRPKSDTVGRVPSGPPVIVLPPHRRRKRFRKIFAVFQTPLTWRGRGSGKSRIHRGPDMVTDTIQDGPRRLFSTVAYFFLMPDIASLQKFFVRQNATPVGAGASCCGENQYSGIRVMPL